MAMVAARNDDAIAAEMILNVYDDDEVDIKTEPLQYLKWHDNDYFKPRWGYHYTCCPYYYDHQTLYTHKEAKHPEKKFTCSTCNMSTIYHKYMKKHIRVFHQQIGEIIEKPLEQ